MNRPGSQALFACVRLAATQHGTIATAQALEAGMSVDGIQRLVESGSWTRIHPRVYALWRPAAKVDRWRQRMSAGGLWLGDDSAASHRAAAAAWTLLKAAPLEFSTTGRRRCPGLIVHHVKALPPGDIVIHEGLRVTSAARTLVDLTAVAKAATVEIAFETALRLKLTTREQIGAALARAGVTHPGKATLRALLSHGGANTESTLETLVAQVLRHTSLPPALRQYVVRDAARFVARVDFAYPDARVAIETDGFEFHSGRKAWRRDRRRQNALTRIGWIVYCITWEDVVDGGQHIVADVGALLATRSSYFREA